MIRLPSTADHGRFPTPGAAGRLALAALLFVGSAVASTPDPSFGTGGISTVPVFASGNNQTGAVLRLPDDSFYVGGDVIARYFADGSLDESFGQLGSVYANLRVSGLARQDDGKVVAVGIAPLDFTIAIAVVRLAADGSPDLAFGGDGRFRLDFASSDADVVLQPDGRIVVSGCDRRTRDNLLFRLDADGSPDLTFGDDGFVVDALSAGDNCANAVVIDDQGRILVAGGGDAQGPPAPACGGDTDAVVARYLADGTRDGSFGVGGVSFIDVAACEDEAFDLALRPDGRIVVGLTSEIPRNVDDFDEDVVVSQLLANGTIDAGFGTAGSSAVDYARDDDEIEGIALASDGSIYVAATVELPADDAGAVLRFLPGGGLDPAFGDAGTVTLPEFAGGAADPCCIALSGSDLPRAVFDARMPGENDFGVAGLLADGQFDPAFGDQGVAVHDFLLQQAVFPRNLVEDASGRLYLTGSDRLLRVLRFAEDGTPDSSWGDGGVATLDFETSTINARYGMLQPDGKFLALADDNRKFLVARFLSDGTPDPAFGSGGQAIIDLGEITLASSLGVQSDGRIVLGGYNSNGNRDFLLVGLEPDGDLDGTFGAAGVARLDRMGTRDQLNDLIVLGDDRIVAVGLTDQVTTDFVATRVGVDGALDAGFGTAGWSAVDIAGVSDTAFGVAEDGDGRLLLVGEARTTVSLASLEIAAVRLLPDGSLDTTFNGDGRTLIELGGIESGRAIAPTTDGGAFLVGSGSGQSLIARLGPDGAPDATFDGDGVASFRLFGGELATGLVVQDERVVLGGALSFESLIGASSAEFLVRGVLKTGAPTDELIFSNGFEEIVRR